MRLAALEPGQPDRGERLVHASPDLLARHARGSRDRTRRPPRRRCRRSGRRGAGRPCPTRARTSQRALVVARVDAVDRDASPRPAAAARRTAAPASTCPSRSRRARATHLARARASKSTPPTAPAARPRRPVGEADVVEARSRARPPRIDAERRGPPVRRPSSWYRYAPHAARTASSRRAP